MHKRQRARRHDQTVVRRASETRDCAFDLGGVVDAEWAQLHTERRRYKLDRPELASASGYFGIPNDPHTRYTRCYLLE
jgi:hypothetical protein